MADTSTITFEIDAETEGLEQQLKAAQKEVEALRRKVETANGKKSAIEAQMESADRAIDATKLEVRQLEEQLRNLENVNPIDAAAWEEAQTKAATISQRITELNSELEKQYAAQDKLATKWNQLDEEVKGYGESIDQATERATSASTALAAAYQQAGSSMKLGFEGIGNAVEAFGKRVTGLIQRAFVFSVITSGLNSLRKSIGEALMANEQFGATWTALQATVQGFATGIANVVAPVISGAVNVVMAAITTLARAIDAVMGTSIMAAIGAARKSSEATWRETDESKAASKELEKQRKAREKAEEAAAKQADSVAKRREKAERKAAQRLEKARQSASERQADAEETAAERAAKAEASKQKAYGKALERSQDRQEAATERREKAERKAAERLAKAEESARARYEKAQTTADERTAASRESAEKRKAAAEARAADKEAKAARRLEKAQKKANSTLLGFDEINRMSAESAEDAADAYDTETDALEDYGYKTYSVDPSEYLVDPEDYAIDPADYEFDPEDFFVDPSDYQFDPSEYIVDPDNYAIDPADYAIDPEDYVIEPFEWEGLDGMAGSVTDAMKPDWASFDVGVIDDKLTEIAAVVAGAMLAVGAILAFSGINVPLGITLMAFGAAVMWGVVAENWDQLPAEVQGRITGMLALTGLVLIALGAVLAFSGAATPLGIGMMVAGALLLWPAAALNWESLPAEIQAAITAIVSIVSVALLFVGAVLLLTGTNPVLGAALMAAGALGLAAVAALNWEWVQQNLSAVLPLVEAVVGGFLLALGAILFFTGANVPLGLGMMAIGAITLGTVLAQNWEWVQEKIGAYLPLIEAAVGGFLLALGAVLFFTGAATPLGLGLMAVGAVTLGATLVENWGWVQEKIGGILPELELTIGAALLVIGAVLLFTGAATPLGLGLLAVGALALGKAVTVDWESLPPEIKGVIAIIEATVSVALLAIGTCLVFTGAALPLGLGLIVAGAAMLAQLATVNWDALPADVKRTVSLLLGIVSAALLVLGVILCFTGVGVALGLGMIIAGAAGLVAEAAINWDFLVDKVRDVWGRIKEFFRTNIKPVFTAQWWGNLFKSIINGLIGMINGGLNVFGSFVNGISNGLAGILGALGVQASLPQITMPQIPQLAQGAVIPPNRRFMAVLGDQPSGRNIETPEALMRQVVREEAGNVLAEMMMQMQSMQPQEDGGDTVLALYIDSEKIAEASAKGTSSLTRRGVLSPTATFI